MKLEYRLVYSPNVKVNTEAIKYTCWDNKLHVRYQDYDTPQVISGFMNKLTYLLTYVTDKKILYETLNTTDLKELNFKDFWKKYSSKVYDSPAFAAIVRVVKSKLIDCDGIEISRNYRKNAYGEALLQFGSLKEGTYPCDENDRGSLDMFVKTIFNDELAGYLAFCKLRKFLFDDGYSIEIVEVNETVLSEANKKYFNKATKKEKRIEELDLWLD